MANRYLHFPFVMGSGSASGTTGRGVGVTDDPERHLRDKVEAVLFTAPGERVNRPDFGVGLNRFVFEGLDDVTRTFIEFRVTDALNRALGEELILDELTIDEAPEEGALTLSISFRRRVDREPRRLEVRL